MGIFENIVKKIKKGNAKKTSLEPINIYLPKTSNVESRLIQPRFPYEYLLELERIIMTNPDLAHAHQVFLDLSNTELKIKAEEKTKNQILQFYKEINIEKLKTHFFNQIILYGAISHEWIVKDDLTGIKDSKIVPIWTIRFAYHEESDTFIPYQFLPPKDTIRMNENTYQYIPLLTLDGSPYGIPPFVSVFAVNDTYEEIIHEIANLATKTGMIGFIDMEITPPARASGETDKEWRDRVREFMVSEADAAQSMIQKGLIIHTSNTKVNYKEIPSSSIGKDITDMLEKWVISSAKMQPSLLGRTTGSTETWAYIAYEQFVRQLKNIQSKVESVIEYGTKLHLLLNNNTEDFTVEFDKPPELDPEKEAKAGRERAIKLKTLLDAGIIEKEEARKEIGYDPKEASVD
jgi:hypothetical protein